MQIGQILAPERVRIDAPATSKKSVLEALAGLIAGDEPDVTQAQVFDSFIARERLGSTGLGHGVAIPHCRVDNATEARAAIIRTDQPVDFDAIDGQPADLFFALAVPAESTQEHLDILATLAGMFSDRSLVAQLRDVDSAQGLFRLVTDWTDAA